METNNKNIGGFDDFSQFGKKLPYDVPSSFFNEFSDKTLELAKQQNRPVRVFKTWHWGVAASVLVLVMLGLFANINSGKVEVAEIKKAEVAVQTVPQIQETKQVVLPKAETKSAREVKKPKPEIKETINDILADLSDEELSQLDAMIKTDPFVEVGIQNSLNE